MLAMSGGIIKWQEYSKGKGCSNTAFFCACNPAISVI